MKDSCHNTFSPTPGQECVFIYHRAGIGSKCGVRIAAHFVHVHVYTYTCKYVEYTCTCTYVHWS